MQGFVNYYIDEPQQNYAVVRGDVDNFKCNFKKTLIDLTDPVQKGINLNYQEIGLKLVDHKSKVQFSEAITDNAKKQYEEELKKLLKHELANVEEIVFFDHNLRTSKTSAPCRSNPAFHVHYDYCQDTARAQATKILGFDKANEWFKEDGHVSIVNIWRPVGIPVEKTPLAVMDVTSFDSKDVVKIRLLYNEQCKVNFNGFEANEQEENYGVGIKENKKHKWYFVNQMSPDQAWIFCQFDTKSHLSVPHSAVEVVGTPGDAKPRRSVESRCLIRYKN